MQKLKRKWAEKCVTAKKPYKNQVNTITLFYNLLSIEVSDLLKDCSFWRINTDLLGHLENWDKK